MNKSLPQHNHVGWPKRDKGKNKGKNKSMSWIIQWLGCTPKVVALWPLWQEVKGSAVAAGINGADMFRSAPEFVSEWRRELTRDVKLYERSINSKFIYIHINSTLSPCLVRLHKFVATSESRTWPLNPDSPEWVIFSPLSTTCAVLLQNPCVSLNNVSNLSHKRRQSQYAREWRQIPDQESHRKLSYVWLYTSYTVNGKTI